MNDTDESVNQSEQMTYVKRGKTCASLSRLIWGMTKWHESSSQSLSIEIQKTDSTFDTQGTSALPDLLTINSYHVANLTYVINGISTTRPQEGSGKCEE